MKVTLYDAGLKSKTIEVASPETALFALDEEGSGYTEAVGKGFRAWRPLGSTTWRPGTLTGEVRARCIASGSKDPGILNAQWCRDLHEDGLSIAEIADRVIRSTL